MVCYWWAIVWDVRWDSRSDKSSEDGESGGSGGSGDKAGTGCDAPLYTTKDNGPQCGLRVIFKGEVGRRHGL
mgnify:CR=1 FL=1|jgi:hypothetical protein